MSQKKNTVLYQLELDQRKVDCGMSYVFAMKDGRFFIIDGGYFTPDEDERLYDFLREHTLQGEKITIAGWFFTHAHQDHIGAFINFMEHHSSDVAIEQFIYNFQPIDFSCILGDWRSSDQATAKEFYDTIKRHDGEFKTVIAHRGDIYRIGEIEIEVLYTQENLWPEPSSFNDYSAVITTTVDGQKILWTGDIADKASAFLLKNCRDKLKCDIVQVAHHGFNGATAELYRAADPYTALWPIPEYRIESNADREANAYLYNNSRVTEHIVSSRGTAALTLPYVPGTYTCEGKKINP